MSAEMDDINEQILPELPVITAKDAAEYLADILPQLALIAERSGLGDVGAIVAKASSAAANKGKAEKG